MLSTCLTSLTLESECSCAPRGGVPTRMGLRDDGGQVWPERSDTTLLMMTLALAGAESKPHLTCSTV